MKNINSRIIISFILLANLPLLSNAAAVLDTNTMPYATMAAYAITSQDLESTNNAYAFRPWFENGSWQGDIIQYNVSSSAQFSTSIDLSSITPSNSGSNWSVRLQYESKAVNYYSNDRKIITSSGLSPVIRQIPFRWLSLSATQKNLLDPSFVNKRQNNILDFIRGDRKNEVNNSPGGLFRKRYSIFGDVIHSDPVYVAAPNSSILDPGYSLFKSQNQLREPRLYVGANDGMLHVFNAQSGDEVYAYIPAILLDKLNLLTKVNYSHQYYVDGGISVGDMDFGNSNWHSVLVASFGAGAKGLFALDVSNPFLTTESDNRASNNKVLWELDGRLNPDLGYIYDKAEILKLPDGLWYIITGNGYGSSSDVASLLLINNLGVISKIEADNSILANGLSRPSLIDINNDGKVDYAYAGDLKGNLYRFDLKTRSKASKLFSAGINKPITTAPQISNHPLIGRIILFATGSLLSESDVNDVSTQSIYGIRDFDNAFLVNNNRLLKQILSTDIKVNNFSSAKIEIVRHIVNPKPMAWDNNDGWQVDLPRGERIVLATNLRAKRFQVMSINPKSQDAWLIQLNYYNGADEKIYFDLNGDLNFDASDTINRNTDIQGNLTGLGDIPVAVKQGVGIFSKQLIMRVSNAVDSNIINGLGLPVIPEPCFENCVAGFALGHIDVDTDSPLGGKLASNLQDRYCYNNGDRAAAVKVDAAGVAIPPSSNSPYIRLATNAGDGLSGATDGHRHEYDKGHGTVEVNYINLEPRCSQTRADNLKPGQTQGKKLDRVTEVGIGNNQEFFVIISNADLSPGSILNIGANQWNVVEYQKIIQQKLDAWLAAGALSNNFASFMVTNGQSLIFTLKQILSAVDNGLGKFSHSFNDRAIIDGGLHPTQTSCVNKSSSITNGRWRNGALITQLIDVKNYILNPNLVLKQKPTDLVPSILINGINIKLIDGNKRYGGLYANNNGSTIGIGARNTAFLYESTLFWHFGILSQLINGTKPCYGELNWEQAKATELAGLTPALLATLLNSANNNIGRAKKALDAAIAAGATQAMIDNLQQKLDSEIAKYKDYMKFPNNDQLPNTPEDITKPSITANATNSSNNSSRQHSFGRKNWIDIRP